MADKAAEKSKLLIRLGRLLAPVHELVNLATFPSANDLRVLAARFGPDSQAWGQFVLQFCKVGNCQFSAQFNDICDTLEAFGIYVRRIAKELNLAPMTDAYREDLKQEVSQLESDILKFLDQIPIEWKPKLMAEKTPFATCMILHDAVNNARTRVDYFDRYLHPDFFDLYLRDLNRSIKVRLITTAGDSRIGVRSITAIAKLAAQEFTSFHVIECLPTDLHDRNLRIDDQVFHLGPSSSQAGSYPTNFNPGDDTPQGHQILDQIIAKGTVVV